MELPSLERDYINCDMALNNVIFFPQESYAEILAHLTYWTFTMDIPFSAGERREGEKLLPPSPWEGKAISATTLTHPPPTEVP